MTEWGSLHCLYVFVCVRSVNSVVSNSLWHYGLQPIRLLCPWEIPLKNDQNYKMGASPLPLCVCVCVRAHTQLIQSCPTLCDTLDCPPGSSVHGILQARILEWVAMPSSRRSAQPTGWTHVSYVSCIAGRFFTHWATWKAPPSPASDHYCLDFCGSTHLLLCSPNSHGKKKVPLISSPIDLAHILLKWIIFTVEIVSQNRQLQLEIRQNWLPS